MNIEGWGPEAVAALVMVCTICAVVLHWTGVI